MATESETTTQQETTVFNDKENFTFKHPLNTKWQLYYDGPTSKRFNAEEWKESLKKILVFDTVEDFWGLYNNIPKPTELASGSNYHLFREGIFPAWEDAANKIGGKWVLELKSTPPQDVEKYWLNAVLFCIGEAFEDPKEVNGIVMAIRRHGHRVALWTRTALDKEKTEALGRGLKKAIELPDNVTITYTSHDEALRRNSSSLYTI
ncbi:translation initiation factor eIF 4e-like domain-containing protein [Paraphysoderma sedebokerense]|nr:translation initiation factor eIF 4e-like domain-containing protein [Paraphysoderma sedebokerense]